MNDNAVNLLKDLASKLGQTVEALWPHAVRYVVVDGIVTLVLCLVFLGLVAYLSPKLLAYARAIEGDSYGPDFGPTCFAVCAGLALLVTFLISICQLPSAAIQVFEPVGYLMNKALTSVPK